MGKISGKKILVVEDDLFSQEVMQDYLEGEGCVVELAPDGRKALKIFDRFKPDLVLLDINIPLLDGISVLKEIIDRKTLARVIMTTGESSFKVTTECVNLGAYTHVVKPIDLDHLGKVVAQALGLEEEGKGFETKVEP